MRYFISLLIFIALNFKYAYSQQVLSEQALAEVAKQNFAPAITELDAILTKNTKNEIALMYRANFLSSMGQFEKSIKDAEEALKINPSNLNVLIIAGGAKVSLKDYPSAIKYLSSAIAIKPDLVPALMMRAKTYVLIEQFSNAIKDFDEVIKVEPKSIEAHLLRGRMYIRNEEPQFALQDYIFVRDNTSNGSPVWEAATKEFTLAEKLYEKIKQNKDAALRQKMAADLQKESESVPLKKAQDGMDTFAQELAILKTQQELVTKVVKDASLELEALNKTPKEDNLKQADAREAARPKLQAIIRVLDKAISLTSDVKDEFSLEARKGWTNMRISTSLSLDGCSEYLVKSHRVMGGIAAITNKTEALAKQVYTAQDNKDKATFDRKKAEIIASLKESITVANTGYKDLAVYKMANLPKFKTDIDSYIVTKNKDLTYFENLKMP